MIIGYKCDGCRMWTRVTNGNIQLALWLTESPKPYYCDECESNITWRETEVKIRRLDKKETDDLKTV